MQSSSHVWKCDLACRNREELSRGPGGDWVQAWRGIPDLLLANSSEVASRADDENTKKAGNHQVKDKVIYFRES